LLVTTPWYFASNVEARSWKSRQLSRMMEEGRREGKRVYDRAREAVMPGALNGIEML
jgi:hypothetical protein